MSPADVAWLAATLRRVEVGEEQWLLVAARDRLAETQRSDGGWDSDDGHQFDVHTTLRAIRACRRRLPGPACRPRRSSRSNGSAQATVPTAAARAATGGRRTDRLAVARASAGGRRR